MTRKHRLSIRQEDSESKFWLDIPTRAVVYPTNRCNYSCNHCYASEFSYKELNFEDYEKIFRRLHRWGVFEIVFLGGEPFSRKDFLAIAAIAKNIGFGVKTSTNGSLISKYNIEETKKLFDGRIQISLDSIKERINDKIRGKGSFRRTMKGIETLLENQTEFSLGIVANNLNYKELPQIYTFAKDKGIKGIHIMRIMPKGRALNNWNVLALTNEKWCGAIKSLREVVKTQDSLAPRLQIDGTYEYSNSTQMLGKCMSGCEAGRYEITIMADGTVVVCDMFDNLKIGDARNIDFEYEWQNNKLYQKFRNSRKKLTGKCGTCEIDFCVGCRYQAMMLNGGFFEADPFCIRNELIKDGKL